MKINKDFILWGFVVLAGLVGSLAWYGYFITSDLSVPGPDLILPTNEATPSETLMPSPEVTPRPSVPVSSTQEPFLGLNGVTSPATCQVGGEVEFTASDSFRSKGSKISWQNIDSRGRLIKWHVSPDDKLAVGPNIFESLSLPSGQYENLTVSLPKTPKSKNYILTASVTYGQFVKGNLEVKETNCSGQVKVILNFE